MGTVHAMPAVAPPQTWFKREKSGAIVFTGQSYEDHVAAWTDAQVQVDAGLWGQARIAASLTTKYGDSDVKRFAHEVKRSAGWIWDLARTYRAFPEKSSQLDYLSFTHHVEAAKADCPKEALEKAHDKEWSTKELQYYVETGVEPAPKIKKGPKQKLGPEMQRIYDRAIREHLDMAILSIRKQTETPPDPLLSSVYRKVIEIMEWQRDRAVESDCMTIMKIFAGEEGSESPEEASADYLSAWLTGHGYIMGDAELDERLELLTRIKLLHELSREGSRGPTQRGSIPGVYCADPGYFEDWDRVSQNPRAPERLAAIHKDWIERLTRYAPEFLPKEEKAA